VNGIRSCIVSDLPRKERGDGAACRSLFGAIFPSPPGTGDLVWLERGYSLFIGSIKRVRADAKFLKAVGERGLAPSILQRGGPLRPFHHGQPGALGICGGGPWTGSKLWNGGGTWAQNDRAGKAQKSLCGVLLGDGSLPPTNPHKPRVFLDTVRTAILAKFCFCNGENEHAAGETKTRGALSCRGS